MCKNGTTWFLQTSTNLRCEKDLCYLNFSKLKCPSLVFQWIFLNLGLHSSSNTPGQNVTVTQTHTKIPSFKREFIFFICWLSLSFPLYETMQFCPHCASSLKYYPRVSWYNLESQIGVQIKFNNAKSSPRCLVLKKGKSWVETLGHALQQFCCFWSSQTFKCQGNNIQRRGKKRPKQASSIIIYASQMIFESNKYPGGKLVVKHAFQWWTWHAFWRWTTSLRHVSAS